MERFQDAELWCALEDVLKCGSIMAFLIYPFPPQVKNETKGLQISEEDRMIGVVSSKLYWNYFRSELNSLAIISLFLLLLISQGKRQFYRSRERIVSSEKPRGVICFHQYNELNTTLLETTLSWIDDGKTNPALLRVCSFR